jgi:site-specific DNA-methyltransferase (adenine-specific)
MELNGSKTWNQLILIEKDARIGGFQNMINIENIDCFKGMKEIENNSIDMILTDPPYNVTVAHWDKHINIELLWNEYKRIIKKNGCIAIFGIEPFTTIIKYHNLKQLKYDWIWVKDKATNFLNCKKQPMRKTETISIFYKKQTLYIPQLYKNDPKNIRPAKKRIIHSNLYGDHYKIVKKTIPEDMCYPNNLLFFNKEQRAHHPAQKPIKLLEYLIKTYTNEYDLILDNFMGGGSTGVAANNLNRYFIGFEIDSHFFQIAKNRIFGYNNKKGVIL